MIYILTYLTIFLAIFVESYLMVYKRNKLNFSDIVILISISIVSTILILIIFISKRTFTSIFIFLLLIFINYFNFNYILNEKNTFNEEKLIDIKRKIRKNEYIIDSSYNNRIYYYKKK